MAIGDPTIGTWTESTNLPEPVNGWLRQPPVKRSVAAILEVDGVCVDWSLNTEPQSYNYDITYRGAAAYAQLEVSPVRNLRLTAGARFDAAHYDYETNLPPIQTGFNRRPADTAIDYNQLTPKLGAVFTVSPRLTLMGGYRRRFRSRGDRWIGRRRASAGHRTHGWQRARGRHHHGRRRHACATVPRAVAVRTLTGERITPAGAPGPAAAGRPAAPGSCRPGLRPGAGSSSQ